MRVREYHLLRSQRIRRYSDNRRSVSCIFVVQGERGIARFREPDDILSGSYVGDRLWRRISLERRKFKRNPNIERLGLGITITSKPCLRKISLKEVQQHNVGTHRAKDNRWYHSS